MERQLRRLSGRADEQRDADEREIRLRRDTDLVEDVREIERAEDEEDRDDADRVAPVADAVHPERLVGRLLRCGLVEPEPDEQVRAQADPLPPHEHEEVVVGHDEDEHREHEKREPREEAMEPVVVRHVPVRVDEDERRHDRDDEQHHRGQWIDECRDVHLEVADADPAVERHRGALLSAEHFGEDADRHQRRGADRGRCDPAGEMTQPAASE